MTLVSSWWAWLALAALLGVAEVLAPAFVFLGFAAGAAATGLLLAIGLDPGAGWTLVAFAALSGLAYAGLRLALGRAGGSARIVRRDVNDN